MRALAGFALGAALGAFLAAVPSVRADDTAKFRLKPGAAGKLCLDCHVDFQDVAKLPHVHTPVKAGQCAECHDPHASEHGKLLAATPDKICATCHGSMVPDGAASAHDTVVAGKCASCHDPHGSQNKNNLIRAGNDLCLGCHDGVKTALAAATNHHTPVDQNCLGCHDPHASKEAEALLLKPAPALCLGCHKTDQPGFAKAHVNYPVSRANCMSCHDPHGSSSKGILWASVHAPVQNKMCAQCHEAPGASGALAVKKTAPDLCRGCHNELFVEIASQNRVHWPVVDQSACFNCHEPHAAKTAKLLKAPQKQLCGSCHTDSVARQEKSLVKHPPIEQGECSTCHAAHGSNATFLLPAATPVELCGTCHDWQKHSSHPIGDKIVDQRNPNLRLDCESCHRSHGSAFKSFAHYDVKNELCTQCHTQFTR
jgi:predicted CXXCH cytochrome family protein